jgi:dipeptidyl aminopeptidase/acylaminoacyl peptidase
MVYAVSSSTVPMELWEDRNGRLRQLTHLNAPFTGLSAPSLFRYTSTDDFEIEAELFTPASQNGRCPLVVLVHPGPPRRWSHAINDWAQVLVKMGLCILAPNIRGSSGYGEGFLVANRNDWGGGDFRDITAGIDVLVAKGVADPDRLGIAGWSYGGFMSASAVTQTHRFKAAVAQSAMLDLETQWGTELAAIVAYDTWYLGRPWDRPELFAQLSPISHVKNVTTPILLLVGADDVINPPAQNWQFNRALRLNGVETELVIYPREGHTILEEAHSRDLMERMADWLSRHIMAARSQP